MTTIEKSGSPKTATTGWFRRAAMATAFAAIGVAALGAATKPAQAHWYGYGYHPYYAYYPDYYRYYPAYHAEWSWGGWNWHHHWHHHWHHW